MDSPVSIQRAANYLAVGADVIRAAIKLGLIAVDENLVVPRSVNDALVKHGVVTECALCGAPLGEGCALKAAVAPPPAEDAT